MQVIGDLVEDVRGDQSALLVHEPDLNMPRSLRETFDFRWLISAVWEESPSQPMCLKERVLRVGVGMGVGVRREEWCAKRAFLHP